MNIYRWVAPLLLSAMVLSCSKGKRLEHDFLDQWRNDPKACNDIRRTVLPDVLALSDQLLARNEMEIVEVLGKPDENELYKRNQKFYYYYIRPGASCDGTGKSSERLVIRFNAMGLAKEIYIE